MARTDEKRVRLEMSEKTLKSLLTAGHVCAADFHCLDGESKQCLWRLCLESCNGHPRQEHRANPTIGRCFSILLRGWEETRPRNFCGDAGNFIRKNA